MLDRGGESALDLTGVVSLPVWAVVAVAAVLVLACALALAGWWARDHFARRDLATAQRALDARGFELATRAFMPGSALGCLDAIAGETVEAACEKVRYATAARRISAAPSLGWVTPPALKSISQSARSTRGSTLMRRAGRPPGAGRWRALRRRLRRARRRRCPITSTSRRQHRSRRSIS